MAAPVVVTSVETLRDPAARVKRSEPAVGTVMQCLPDSVRGVPGFRDATEIVRTSAIVEAGAALLLGSRRFRRLGAIALAGTLGPRTLVLNSFWSEQDLEERTRQRTSLLADLGLIGGALLVASDRVHEASSSRVRSRRRARRTARRAAVTVGVRHGVRRARAHSRELGSKARDAGSKVGELGGRAVDATEGGGAAMLVHGTRAANKGARMAREAQERGTQAIGETMTRAQGAVTKARS